MTATSVASGALRAADGQVLMTRRERREAEQRAAEAAARESSGDTVVVGGIAFYGPAPVSPAFGNPVASGSPVPALYSRNLDTTHQGHAPQTRSRRPAPKVSPAPAPAPGSARPAPEAAAPPAPFAPVEPAAAPEGLPAVLPRDERRRAARGPFPDRYAAPAGFPAVHPRPAAPAAPAAALASTAPAPANLPVTPGVERADRTADLRSRAERAGRPPSAPTLAASAPAAGRKRSGWLPRVAVLGTLAAATIAAPLTPGGAAIRAGGSPFDLDLAKTGPSTLDVVATPVQAAAVSPGIAAAIEVERSAVVVSRSDDRDPLPGCDTEIPLTSSNGKLGDAELCELPFSAGALQARAAVALTALNQAYRAEFGVDLALVDTYRTLSEQYAVKRSRGYLAATPGTSMHGFGYAIDLADSVTGSSAAYRWLRENGAAYGWENPPWARRGGSGKYEPWHFEFRPGVEQVSTWH